MLYNTKATYTCPRWVPVWHGAIALIIVPSYMLLYGRRRAFEYLVNFEPVDSIGSLSQMDIQIFIERQCGAMYTSPGRRAHGVFSLYYLVLRSRRVSLGIRRRHCASWSERLRHSQIQPRLWLTAPQRWATAQRVWRLPAASRWTLIWHTKKSGLRRLQTQ